MKLDEKYIEWIRDLPCVFCLTMGIGTKPPSEPHHIPRKGHGSTAMKTDDRRAVPACRGHHDEYHRGRESFEVKYNVDYEFIVEELNRIYDERSTVHPSGRASIWHPPQPDEGT